jgi:hypothetical protein
LGSKENAWRHFGQKPVVRPGCPSLPRPTGFPQLEQNRFSSGTTGSFMIALLASMAGNDGMVVRPAPSRAVRSRWDSERTRRVLALPPRPARAEPRAVDASRLLARDIVDGELETPAGPVAALTGSDSPEAPQVSQYPSRILPLQPGWLQGMPLGMFDAMTC